MKKNTKKDINIPAMQSDKYMAVYGTLRDNSGMLGTVTGGKLVFPGHTYYPAWVRDGSTTKTVVELKAVSRGKLEQLDAYESVSRGLYKRTNIDVHIPELDGTIKAWIYEAGDQILNSKERFKPVPKGDWLSAESKRIRKSNAIVQQIR